MSFGKEIFLLVILIGLLTVVIASAQESKGLIALQNISPLLSTRADVQDKIGNPIDDPKHDHSWLYDFDEGRMNITFEIGKCIWQPGTQTWSGWKVPEGSVTSVWLSFRKPVKPSKIGVDLSRLTKVKIGGDPSSYEYSDAKKGLIYNVNNGKILDIERRPREDQQSLKCISKSSEKN